MPPDSQVAIKAAIKRAIKASQTATDKLDASALKATQQLYEQAAADLAQRIAAHAGPDGNLGLAELQSALAQVKARIQQLAQDRNALLQGSLAQAADHGAGPFANQAGGPPSATIGVQGSHRVADEALAFVRTFVAADGLQLSDRIWRLDRHAQEITANAIEQAVIQGQGADQAAREFLARGLVVPPEVRAKIGAANADKLGRVTANRLLKGDGNGAGAPLDNALRLFRTEINRAHGVAFQKGAAATHDAIGTRFLLSPRHPKHDICDLYAHQNLYGLGPGVYPHGKSPWPAHPNTLSYEEIVFADEVSTADKAGKQTPMQALEQLTPEQRRGVLGTTKAKIHATGELTQGMIRAPLRALSPRVRKVMAAKEAAAAAAAEAKRKAVAEKRKAAREAKKAAPVPQTLDEMIAAGRALTDSLLAAAEKADASDLGEAFRAQLLAALAKVRPIDTPTQVQGSGAGAASVREASKFFPDAWTRAADVFGPLKARAINGRGSHRTIGPLTSPTTLQIGGFGPHLVRGGEGFILTDSLATSAHEFAHRLQHVHPSLDDYFQDLHQRRTRGAEQKKLRALQPGFAYGRDEVAREDKYFHPYQGREYPVRGVAYRGKHGALEVMTMAFEQTLGFYRFSEFVVADREMLDLTTGLLFHYEPNV